MKTLLITLLMVAVPPSDTRKQPPVAPYRNMHVATYAVRDADEVIAKMPLDEIFWIYRNTDGPPTDATAAQRAQYVKAKKQYTEIIEAVRLHNSFVNPVRMSLVIASSKVNTKGQVLLDGTFQPYAMMVDQYRTKDEQANLDAYKAETDRLSADIDKRMATEEVPSEEIQRQRRMLDNRRAEYNRWTDELAQIAQPRKDHLEFVKVHIVVPADMAKTLHLDKLLEAKRVLITMRVEDFDLKSPLKELTQPARIGSISGPCTDIVEYLKKG